MRLFSSMTDIGYSPYPHADKVWSTDTPAFNWSPIGFPTQTESDKRSGHDIEVSEQRISFKDELPISQAERFRQDCVTLDNHMSSKNTLSGQIAPLPVAEVEDNQIEEIAPLPVAEVEDNQIEEIAPLPMAEVKDDRTTIIIKHIPCRYKQQEIQDEISALGFDFDFVYLPHAQQSSSNLGYAFVNFVRSEDAMIFCDVFQGHHWKFQPNSKKRAEVEFAHIQGLDANIAYFYKSHPATFKEKYRPFIALPCLGTHDDKIEAVFDAFDAMCDRSSVMPTTKYSPFPHCDEASPWSGGIATRNWSPKEEPTKEKTSFESALTSCGDESSLMPDTESSQIDAVLWSAPTFTWPTFELAINIEEPAA
jgi:RNA recognition motif-containing protein